MSLVSRLPQYLKIPLSCPSRTFHAHTHLLDARNINGCRHSSLIYRHVEEAEVVEREQRLKGFEPVFIRRELTRETHKYSTREPKLQCTSYGQTELKEEGMRHQQQDETKPAKRSTSDSHFSK